MKISVRWPGQLNEGKRSFLSSALLIVAFAASACGPCNTCQVDPKVFATGATKASVLSSQGTPASTSHSEDGLICKDESTWTYSGAPDVEYVFCGERLVRVDQIN
jgi:hypothetical protein